MTEPIAIDVNHEFSRLRSFQRDTANYAFDRLFGHGTRSASRFLVADEVGLGKTLVARGVIAKAITHLQTAGDTRVDIVYICSNGAIAAQNLRKLAPTGIHVEQTSQRLSLLPFTFSTRVPRAVNLIALTPGTSFDMGGSTGRMIERAAALRALQQLWGARRLMGEGIGRFFAWGIQDYVNYSASQRIRDEATCLGSLSNEALDRFGHEIDLMNAAREHQGLDDLDGAIHRVARYFRRDDPADAAIYERRMIIGELREALANTGAHLLQPDVVIVDEFQRFRDIIHNRPEAGHAGEIANHLFSYHHEEFNRQTRVLMLSATPYVMHTTSAEAASGSDSHYADFLETYRFLAAGLPGTDADAATTALRSEMSTMRSALMDARVDGIEPARVAAEVVSARLRQVMARTERLASTPDRDGMLRTVDEGLSVPSTKALEQYISAARVAEHLSRHTKYRGSDVVEYWKSAPYTLSYVGAHGYQLADGIRTLVGPDSGEVGHPFDSELLKMLQDSPAVLPWEGMRSYDAIDPAHAGLARLWKDFFDNGQAHRLLWMPASLPYYRADSIFETDKAKHLTKRLIFSSWTLVPTAIATLTTYESERLLHDEAAKVGAVANDYDDERRFAPRLRFGTDTTSMTSLQFAIPSPALARLGDPLAEAALMRAEGVNEPTWSALVDRVTSRIDAEIRPLIEGLPVGRGAGSTSWYTLAPVLLDGENIHRAQGLADVDNEDTSAMNRHRTELERLRRIHRGDGADTTLGDLPPVPTDLARVLAIASLAGPTSVMLRAFARLFPSAPNTQLVDAAGWAAEGFRSLFNSPEANRIIDTFEGEGDFWHKLLVYCGHGNLQSVMDEFCAVLVESRGYDRAEDQSLALREIADDVRKTLSLRTAVYRPAVVTTDGDNSEPRWRQLRLRGRFAMRYGSDSTEEKSEQRVTDVGLAFNSPFWPFVLATTSVGQEGLDFHQYCHAVSHWNLPGNPVDLEQREGRVHRYKGHAVRKNVAATVPFPDSGAAPWKKLFEAARNGSESDDSDMIPYWVFAPKSMNGNCAMIERHLPLTPFTREKSIIGPLLSSVAYYRLAFGQPRQDELIQIVTEGVSYELREELATIRVELSPQAHPKSEKLRS